MGLLPAPLILAHYILWRLTDYEGPVMLGYVVAMAAAMWIIIETVDWVVKRNRNPMTADIKKLTHPVTRALIEALQQGDKSKWLSLFADNAQLFDDGTERDLKQFTSDALGHERFMTIDNVENNGLSIVGKFHTEQWGDFVTYFRLTLDRENKISRLDLGQA